MSETEHIQIKVGPAEYRMVFGSSPYLSVRYLGELQGALSGNNLAILHRAIGLAIGEGTEFRADEDEDG